jgi:hypothetical protein
MIHGRTVAGIFGAVAAVCRATIRGDQPIKEVMTRLIAVKPNTPRAGARQRRSARAMGRSDVDGRHHRRECPVSTPGENGFDRR